MGDELFLADSVIRTWKTNNRITSYLIEQIPDELWKEKVPGYQKKTVQMIAGHIHNTRCMWLKSVGRKVEINTPDPVDRYSVTQKSLLKSLALSSDQVINILNYYLPLEKNIPGFGLDVVHFLNYLTGHEAHHRGQIIMISRQLDFKLPDEVTYGVWKWSLRSKEV